MKDENRYDPIKDMIDKLPNFYSPASDEKPHYAQCYIAICDVLNTIFSEPESGLSVYCDTLLDFEDVDESAPSGSKENPLSGPGPIGDWLMENAGTRYKLTVEPWLRDEET